jgi:hypothetical protein
MVTTWDGIPVGGLVFLAVHRLTPAPDPASSHELWVGLLIGALIGGIFARWIAFVVAGIAFIAAGFLPSAGHYAHSVKITYLLVGGIALAVGLYFGRVRGLRHLGEHELNVRRGYIRGISRF